MRLWARVFNGTWSNAKKKHLPESASFELKWLLCKVEPVASSEMKYRQFVFHLKKNTLTDINETFWLSRNPTRKSLTFSAMVSNGIRAQLEK